MKKLLLLALLISSMFAESFTYNITNIYNAKGKKIGALNPLVKLKIINTKKNKVQVELTTWGGYGFTNVLFKNFSQRQAFGFLDEKQAKKVQKILKTSTDIYGGKWQQVINTFYVNKKDLKDDFTKEQDTIKKLYQSRCAVCHPQHESKEHTVNQWPGIIKMMAPRAGLNANDKARIIAYLQTNAKDAK